MTKKSASGKNEGAVGAQIKPPHVRPHSFLDLGGYHDIMSTNCCESICTRALPPSCIASTPRTKACTHRSTRAPPARFPALPHPRAQDLLDPILMHETKRPANPYQNANDTQQNRTKAMQQRPKTPTHLLLSVGQKAVFPGLLLVQGATLPAVTVPEPRVIPRGPGPTLRKLLELHVHLPHAVALKVYPPVASAPRKEAKQTAGFRGSAAVGWVGRGIFEGVLSWQVVDS